MESSATGIYGLGDVLAINSKKYAVKERHSRDRNGPIRSGSSRTNILDSSMVRRQPASNADKYCDDDAMGGTNSYAGSESGILLQHSWKKHLEFTDNTKQPRVGLYSGALASGRHRGVVLGEDVSRDSNEEFTLPSPKLPSHSSRDFCQLYGSKQEGTKQEEIQSPPPQSSLPQSPPHQKAIKHEVQLDDPRYCHSLHTHFVTTNGIDHPLSGLQSLSLSGDSVLPTRTTQIIRRVTLQRCFKTWNDVRVCSKLRLRDLSKLVNFYQGKRCLSNALHGWKRINMALNFEHSYVYDRFISTAASWVRRYRCTQRSRLLAVHHYRFCSYQRFFDLLFQLRNRKQRRDLKHKSLYKVVLKTSLRSLQKWFFLWRLAQKKVIAANEIQQEQIDRQNKIRAFVKNISKAVPPQPPQIQQSRRKTSEQGRPNVGIRNIRDIESKLGGPSKESSPPNYLNRRSATVDKNAAAEDKKDGITRAPLSVGGDHKYKQLSSARNDKKGEFNVEGPVPAQQFEMTGSEDIEDCSVVLKKVSVADMMDDAYDSLSAPPSYEKLVGRAAVSFEAEEKSPSPRRYLTKKTDSTVTSKKSDIANEGRPGRTMADRRAREDKPSQLLHINVENSAARDCNYPVQQPFETLPSVVSQRLFEERAAARKERLAVLKKEALDRVALKRSLDEAKKRSREEEEQEEVERLRNESRAKLVKQQQQHSAAVVLPSSGRTAVGAVSSGGGGGRDRDQKKLLLRGWKKPVLDSDFVSQFRYRQLLSRFGFGPWCYFMELVHVDRLKAESFANDRLKMWAWSALLGSHRAFRAERARHDARLSLMASAHYKRKLLRHMFRRWSLQRKILRAKAKAVTGHFSRFTLVRRSLAAWKTAYQRSLGKEAQLMRTIGVPRGNKTLLKNCWRRWLKYHSEAQFEREARIRANNKWARMQSYLRK